jgi:hypothetical protein
MATRFEAICEYLRHHDWVPDPRHAADDPVMEINTFLNGLVGQGLDQSHSGSELCQDTGLSPLQLVIEIASVLAR